jgi:hypothetical protein
VTALFTIQKSNKVTAPLEFYKYKPKVDKPGFVSFDRMITYKELDNGLEEYLKSHTIKDERDGEVKSAYDWLDYVHVDYEARKKETAEIPQYHWIYAFMLHGSNEGFYFHIAARLRENENFTNIVTAKTLSFDISIALKINEIFNRFILENE